MRLSNRQVKAAFWEDPDLLRLPRDARMLFHGLLHLADDSGCLKHDTFAIKMFLFRSPLDDDMTEERIDKLISELLRRGFLRKFETDLGPCLFIVNFHKHQKLDNPRPPSCPLPPWVKWVPYKSNPSAGKYVVEQISVVSDDHLSDSKAISGDLRGGSENLSLEPEPEHEHEPNNISAPPIERVPYQKIVDLYHELCPSLPKVIKLTDARKSAIKSRWQEYDQDLETFRKLFRMAEESDFLSGRSGAWKGCNFDWLIRPNNMIKVLEGNYNRGRLSPRNSRTLDVDPPRTLREN